MSSERLSPSSDNISNVQGMATPCNVGQVRSLLGMANYYRRLIPDDAHVMKPTSRLLRKNVAFTWSRDQDQALEATKEALTHPPLLAYPDRKQVTILTTYASGVALGAVLSQSPDGTAENETVIAYESKIMGNAARFFCAVGTFSALTTC